MSHTGDAQRDARLPPPLAKLLVQLPLRDSVPGAKVPPAAVAVLSAAAAA
jgi:hypothetical protein